ncbi:hypothetical protein MOQ72_44050 [Saccharopolyspora sp. K220]|uniref:hypothetical protein n=1 Tax=Saccharopolyspora soli TaxID=2926618 RepID=UPI001F5834A4|nr:hypothetical protein [Saccharopolyspora soli]MCI2424379.1 hypothetical protein [Saccharopolyspora soli]
MTPTGCNVTTPELARIASPPETGPEAATAQFELSTLDAIATVHHVLPGMTEHGRGTVLLTTGVSSTVPALFLGNVGLAMAGLRNWALALHIELAPRGIHARRSRSPPVSRRRTPTPSGTDIAARNQAKGSRVRDEIRKATSSGRSTSRTWTSRTSHPCGRQRRQCWTAGTGSTSSSAPRAKGGLDSDDLMMAKGKLRPTLAYNWSKLTNILYTREFARQLEGSGVDVNVAHPGAVDTPMVRALFDYPAVRNYCP